MQLYCRTKHHKNVSFYTLERFVKYCMLNFFKLLFWINCPDTHLVLYMYQLPPNIKIQILLLYVDFASLNTLSKASINIKATSVCDSTIGLSLNSPYCLQEYHNFLQCWYQCVKPQTLVFLGHPPRRKKHTFWRWVNTSKNIHAVYEHF